MKFIIYAILYPIIWLTSSLPLRVLYFISDLLFLLVYYVIGYRKDVVMNNLKLSFPNKNETELKIIHKKFYRYFMDFFVESIKSLTISEKSIRKRFKFKNPEVINDLYNKDRSIALMMAHYGNWEWVISLPFYTKIDCYAAYTKVNNPYFEKIVKKYRSKFGMILVRTNDVMKTIVSNHSNKKLGLFVLGSDQSPQLHKAHYWRNFFGNRVPVHTGGEMIARKFNYAVVNGDVERIKRGYYELTFETITEDANSLPQNKVIDIYTEMMEKHISKRPEFYLWSHKRYKHMGKEPKKEA